jgi:chemotaxis protein MotB
MPGRLSRQRVAAVDYWPGFVDALATLLLVIFFLLSVFMLGQFFLNQELTGRDRALERLNLEIAELTEALNLQRSENSSLEDRLSQLTATLGETEDRLARAESRNAELSGLLEGARDRAASLADALAEEEALSEEARNEVALLNQQLAALRQQMASLNEALEAAEAKNEEQAAQIVDLGERLNAALATKVAELARYRSEFFGRLKEILGDRSDIRVVGDRFVFQSEVLFQSGEATLNPAGERQLDRLATALQQIGQDIPDDIDWVLRVDGHSDRVPISTPEYPTNWHLSAARAISVVRYLIDQGVPPRRLVAAGFGEFQPLDTADTPAAYRRNRRIELKLDQR